MACFVFLGVACGLISVGKRYRTKMNIADYPLIFLNRPEKQFRSLRLNNFVFCPYLLYGWNGWMDTHLLIFKRPYIQNCHVVPLELVVSSQMASRLYKHYYHISALPAIATRFIEGYSTFLPNRTMELLMLSDTRRSIIVYAAYAVSYTHLTLPTN